ncbi:MAG: hypothetical protein HY235_02745 [Acidobacteria bacterium]|nr:hypothetical protein [Acidobacteriota bacterium]
MLGISHRMPHNEGLWHPLHPSAETALWLPTASKAMPWIRAACGVGAALAAQAFSGPLESVMDGVKLAVAAAVGQAIAVWSRPQEGESNPALEHAQVLLCICGALMAIVVGNSFARALSLAGVASVVRFRTPLKNPKDAAVFFLLLGLGMSCGVGAFHLAAAGTAFLSVLLAVLAGKPGSGVNRATQTQEQEEVLR